MRVAFWTSKIITLLDCSILCLRGSSQCPEHLKPLPYNRLTGSCFLARIFARLPQGVISADSYCAAFIDESYDIEILQIQEQRTRQLIQRLRPLNCPAFVCATHTICSNCRRPNLKLTLTPQVPTI